MEQVRNSVSVVYYLLTNFLISVLFLCGSKINVGRRKLFSCVFYKFPILKQAISVISIPEWVSCVYPVNFPVYFLCIFLCICKFFCYFEKSHFRYFYPRMSFLCICRADPQEKRSRTPKMGIDTLNQILKLKSRNPKNITVKSKKNHQNRNHTRDRKGCFAHLTCKYNFKVFPTNVLGVLIL